jgi:transposase
VIETGRPIAEVARDLGVHDGTLGSWMKALRDADPEPEQGLSPVERARVKELEDRAPAAADGERVPERKAATFFARAHP